jgi:predicted NBD/HSP70 family sugar kinase
MMYLGLDAGKRWHEAALVDADGAVVRRLRFAPTRAGLTALGTWLDGVTPTDVQIGLEAACPGCTGCGPSRGSRPARSR